MFNIVKRFWNANTTLTSIKELHNKVKYHDNTKTEILNLNVQQHREVNLWNAIFILKQETNSNFEMSYKQFYVELNDILY